MLSLTLPFPPSVNHVYGRHGNHVYLKKAGREYRERVVQICRDAKVERQTGALALFATVNPPDRRKRDVGNLDKALLDALQAGGCFDDDCQVRAPVWMMEEPVPGGVVSVLICQHRTASQRLAALRDSIAAEGEASV